MQHKNRIIVLLAIFLAVIVIVSIVVGIIVKRSGQMKHIEIGMSEREVFRIWGDPDETILGRDGTRSLDYYIYMYELESGERILTEFLGDSLIFVYMQTQDNRAVFFATDSLGKGTQIYVCFSTGEYEVIRPDFSVLFDDSTISIEQVCQLEKGMDDASFRDILGEPKIINEYASGRDYIYNLSNRYQLRIRMRDDSVNQVYLTNPKGDRLVTLIFTSSPQGTRITFDRERGAFYESYPLANIDIYPQSDFLQFNNIEKGMTEDEVIAELESWNIIERRTDRTMYYEYTEIIYGLVQNTTIEMVFQETLIGVRVKSDRGIYILLENFDPIGTRIQYDPETGYISREYPVDD